MRNSQKLLAALTLLSTIAVPISTVLAQGTAFTYQGRLDSGGAPASGLYDFRFKLYSDPLGNNQVGPTFVDSAVPATNGLFLATVDFGPGIFAGTNFWLEVDVRTNNTGGYTDLAPLQPLTPAPYAIFANSSSNLLGPILPASLSGAFGAPISFTNPANTFAASSFTGNGAGLTNLNAASLGGVGAGSFWQLGGNTVAGGQFLGSTNNQPVEIWAGGARALRFEPNTNGAPNVIGGSPINYVDPGIVGATIAGGGNMSGNFFLGGGSNHVGAIFGTIAGGRVNTVVADHAFIGGGISNTVEMFAYDGVIGGGVANNIQTNASECVLGGGLYNSIGTFAQDSFLGGGEENQILAQGSVLCGGIFNSNAGQDSFLGGGYQNSMSATYGFLGGGYDNSVTGYAGSVAGGLQNLAGQYGFVGGGAVNSNSASYGFLGGGYGNLVSGYAGSVAGGYQNSAGGQYGFVGGGIGNSNSATYAFLGGGYGNVIGFGNYGFLGGGYSNSIGNYLGSVVGGFSNSVSGYAGSVAGGFQNSANGQYGSVGGGFDNNSAGNGATVSGGNQNNASGLNSTIPGGSGNTAAGNASFAAGTSANAAYSGSFVWSDNSSGSAFSSTKANQFCVRAIGGVSLTTSGAGLTVDGPLQSGTIQSGNIQSGDIVMSTGGPYRNLSMSGGNAVGYLYGSYAALGDGIHLGYNYYYDSSGTGHLINSGGGTSRISVGYGTIDLAVGTTGAAPTIVMLHVTPTGICANGTISNCSDRNAKQDVNPVDPEQILERTLQLPVSQWSYKIDAATRHIGPMAQDFYAAFAVGGDEKHIATIDEEGVALAAIQGLNRKVEDKSQAAENQIEELKNQNAKLQSQVSDLKSELDRMQQVLARLAEKAP